MKRIDRIKIRWKGMIDTVIRFPMTIFMLAAAMVTNAVMINNTQDNELFIKLTITFIVGAFLSTVLQLVYERFATYHILHIVVYVAEIGLTVLYYASVRNIEWTTVTIIRTIIILFILLIAFMWVPVIKSRVNFNDSFLAAFKAFFITAFFFGVLFIGTALILGAVNMLLFTISSKAYIHSANIIFLLFSPIYFLSLIPYYPSKEYLGDDDDIEPLIEVPEVPEDEKKCEAEENQDVEIREIDEDPDEKTYEIKEDPNEKKEYVILKSEELLNREAALIKLTTPSRFLEALISYVIIPITAIFTIILLLYIVTNITGEFWTDNLMEPLLVSYSIVVIIVYLLASTLNNTFTKYFRMIFPKVLVPVVLFQTISSVLKIGEVGITYGRYYVIMFGIFATAAGIVFCFKPVSKNGLIAPILILLSVISIMPAVNAFNVSKVNQISRLESTLRRNDMLSGETLTPKADIPEADKKKIASAVMYLNSMKYTENIKWLSGYRQTYDFERTFGFPIYEQASSGDYTSVIRDPSQPIPVQGYDFIARMNVYDKSNGYEQKTDYVMNGKTYTLRLEVNPDNEQEIVLEENQVELNRFAMKEVYNKFEHSSSKGMENTQDVTFTQDNTTSTITVIAENININFWNSGMSEQADLYILVKIK